MSPRSVNGGGFQVIRVDSSVDYTWMNCETQRAFDAMHQRMLNVNRNKDRSIRSSTSFTLPGVQERQLLKLDPTDTNSTLRQSDIDASNQLKWFRMRCVSARTRCLRTHRN